MHGSGVTLAILTAAALLLGGTAVPAQHAPSPREPEATGSVPSRVPLDALRRENTSALMREWAEDVVYAYLDAWSSNRTALAGLDDLYAPQVSFFGRRVDRAVIRRNKARFARRWPVRHYDHRPGTMEVACDVDAKLCRVRSILDYRVESPVRQARSEGSAAFDLRISFAGPNPAIVSETGRVLRTRSASR